MGSGNSFESRKTPDSQSEIELTIHPKQQKNTLGNTKLSELIDQVSKNHSDLKKSYIGQNIDLKVLSKVKNKIKLFDSSSEEIYYTCTAGVFSFVTYFIVLTNKNIHCRVSHGYLGFTKSCTIPLSTIKSIEVKSTWTKPVYGGGMYGPELHINSKLVGWMTQVSEKDEKLLLELFAEINRTGILL